MTSVTADPEVARLVQGLADFKDFVSQRFLDQNKLLDERDRRQTLLLDERFRTQTTVLDAAFSAAEKARQEALSTAADAAARTDSRIKSLEDNKNTTTGRGMGRADIWGYIVGAAGVVYAFVAVAHH